MIGFLLPRFARIKVQLPCILLFVMGAPILAATTLPFRARAARTSAGRRVGARPALERGAPCSAACEGGRRALTKTRVSWIFILPTHTT